MPNDSFWIINELLFSRLIFFGSRESKYTAKVSSSFMIPLLFFSCLKFRETSAEGSFAYYACCSKQGTLRYFRKSELSLSEKDFFGDCVFCVGESCFEREIFPGFWYIRWLYSRCSPRRKPGGLGVGQLSQVSIDRPFPLPQWESWLPFIWLHSVFFNLLEPIYCLRTVGNISLW